MNVDRREFLQTLSGIVVLIGVGDIGALEDLIANEGQQRGYPTDLNAYLRIAPDGRVTVFSGKIEMGQGVTTSLAQMAAEELGVRLDSIEMIMGDTASCPYDAGTWGSLTTRVFGPALRAAASEARQLLLQLAAERLRVPVEQLHAAKALAKHAHHPKRDDNQPADQREGRQVAEEQLVEGGGGGAESHHRGGNPAEKGNGH